MMPRISCPDRVGLSWDGWSELILARRNSHGLGRVLALASWPSQSTRSSLRASLQPHPHPTNLELQRSVPY
jgi:hypothetical protein